MHRQTHRSSKQARSSAAVPIQSKSVNSQSIAGAPCPLVWSRSRARMVAFAGALVVQMHRPASARPQSHTRRPSSARPAEGSVAEWLVQNAQASRDSSPACRASPTYFEATALDYDYGEWESPNTPSEIGRRAAPESGARNAHVALGRSSRFNPALHIYVSASFCFKHRPDQTSSADDACEVVLFDDLQRS